MGLLRELELVEVISFSDAVNNARTLLEDLAPGVEPEAWAGIERHIFPLLEAEGERLSGEYRRLRSPVDKSVTDSE